MTLVKKIYYWIPTLVWMGLIYYLSSNHAISASQVSWQDFTVKKGAHLVIYFILAVWVYRSLRFTTNLSKLNLIILTVILVGMYAATDEFHQSFVPTRMPSPRDVGIDIIGAAFGAWWVENFVYKKPLTRKSI